MVLIHRWTKHNCAHYAFDTMTKLGSGTASRSSSKGRVTSNSNGEIDRTTQQLIFFKCTVCSVARTTRKAQDAKNQEVMGQLISSQLKKRHAHGAILTCLEDRLNFKKTGVFSRTPFRNWVMYREIEHYFVFPQHPTLFMIAVKAPTEGDLIFETYKCKTPTDTNRLCELVCRACQSGSKTLSANSDQDQRISAYSDVSIHSKSISQVNLHDSVESFDHEHDNEVVENQVNHERTPSVRMSPVSPTMYREPSPFHHEGMVDEVSHQMSPKYRSESPVEMKFTKSNYVAAAPSPRPDFLRDDDDGTTYFDYNPVTGATLNNEGPIYMYLKRFPPAETRMSRVNSFR
ncbi:unnamed protein product [Calicophoron daubneyi]|uniref:Trematode PH-like domain-containing protein n=1 Tax=Calicophoron daubneyi TaxID=300641 RepID=A0AAV2TJY9_CALDB